MELTRRKFVAGAAAASAVTAAATAGIPAAQAEAASWLPDSWDYECDVLVIGYGGAGLWACLTAYDETDSEVLVLEKAPVRGGGSSSINMGEYAWVDDPEAAARYIEGFTKGHTPADMARAWAEEAYYNLDYCDYWGIYTEVKKGSNASGGTSSCEYPQFEGSEAMHVCAFGDPSEGGNAGWRALDQVRRDLGIEVVFGCHDEELIQNPETREIVGCYTLIGDDAEPKAVKARKGVIITTGGFEYNEELQEKYLKCYPSIGFYGWPFNTGDGIGMVEHVGAQLWNMNMVCGSYCAFFRNSDYPYGFWCLPSGNGFIMVDQKGNRWWSEDQFMNPHVGFTNFLHFDNDLVAWDRCPTWYVFDQTVIDAGPIGQLAGGIMATPAGMTKIGMGLDDVPDECFHFPGWSEDNSVEIANGMIISGDTVEELCAKMAEVDAAPDAAALKATLERYNGYCADGFDPELGRAPETLQAIQMDGPFYAYAVYPGGNNTMGGAKKNVNAQVLDIDDQVIPRLYAAGSFGNFQAHAYGITGGNNAENMVWGRIAGRHCGGLEPWC